MNSTRGEGIGVEFDSARLRAVRLRADVPGRVAEVASIPLRSRLDDDSLFDAFVRVERKMGGPVPLRIAYFPQGASWQVVDITGRTGPEINQLLDELARDHQVMTTAEMTENARRMRAAIDWPEVEVAKIRRAAERVGFGDVAVEPSPVSLERVLSTPTGVLTRHDGATAWVAAYDGGHVQLAVARQASTQADDPTLVAATTSLAPPSDSELRSQSEIAAVLDELGPVTAGRSRRRRRAAEAVNIEVVGDPYPSYPESDDRHGERIAVALGAAIDAAGLSRTRRRLHITTPRRATDERDESPWVVYRHPPSIDDQQRPPWWRRLSNWLRRLIGRLVGRSTE